MSSSALAETQLFKPIQLGAIKLQHRIAMAPLTRSRASETHAPLNPMVSEYYAQRACVPGTLLISEAAIIGQAYGNYACVPGIYTAEHIAAWKPVTAAVHARGSFIFCQLWALGRAADPVEAAKDGVTIMSSSDVPMRDAGFARSIRSDAPAELKRPKPMTKDDIRTAVQDYATAARNAIEAGFDGVEIHGANGYLIDQFLQDCCNRRDDEYGGSVANRSRFALEVVDAVVAAVGADRTAIRLSPFSKFGDMGMDNPVEQFSDVLRRIAEKHALAYVHMVLPRISGVFEVETTDKLAPILQHWSGPLLLAGGFKSDNVITSVENECKGRDNVVVVFGRYFISNPDLVYRLKHGIELSAYDRSTFYTPMSQKGYTDYPFCKEFLHQ